MAHTQHRHRTGTTPTRHQPQQNSPPQTFRCGDLAVVTHDDVTRIVCVTAVTDTHLAAVLCSNEVEMATDHDVVAHRDGTYDLLLEAECYLVVLGAQVRCVVGTVDHEAVNAVRTSLSSDGASVAALATRPGYGTGLPLGGLDDPRRTFAARELGDVIVLREPAHTLLVGGRWNPDRRTRHT